MLIRKLRKARRIVITAFAVSALISSGIIPAHAGNIHGSAHRITGTADVSEEEAEKITDAIPEKYGDGRITMARAGGVYAALSLTGKASYKFGGMHGTYKSSKNDVSDLSDFRDADSSGYISYVLYKSGAEGFDGRFARSTVQLAEIGTPAETEDIKPGDILVKTPSKGKKPNTGHVAMYIGPTRYGDFTIAECTVKGNISGPQVSGYDSYKDFIAERGGKWSIRDPYLTLGKLTPSNDLTAGKKTKVRFGFTLNDGFAGKKPAKTFTLYEQTDSGKPRKIGKLKRLANIKNRYVYAATFSLKRKFIGKRVDSPDGTYRFVVMDKKGNRSNTVRLAALSE